MSFTGWAALLNGVLLGSDCSSTQADFDAICPQDLVDDEDNQLARLLIALDGPPTGLGVPPVRTEDLTYPQRDGVKHFNDWYEPRVLEFRASVCPDDCPACGGVGTDGLTARQKVALITEAWQRQCCDVELVLFTDCNGALDPSTQYPSEDGDTLRTNLALNPEAIETGFDGEWLTRFPGDGTETYETVDGPLAEVPSWKKKTITTPNTDDGFDHYQSVDAVTPVGDTPLVDWTETWADLTNWTGTGWAVAGGTVESITPEATIYRDTSDVIGKIELDATFGLTLELLDSDETVLGSVQFPPDATFTAETLVTVTGSDGTTDAANGDGADLVTVELDLSAGTMTVSSALPAPWSAQVPFTGQPTRVRLVAPDGAVSNGDWTSGTTNVAVAVDPSSGDVYVGDNNGTTYTVTRFDADGAVLDSWTVANPIIAIAVDDSGNIPVLTNGTVYRYDSSGALLATIVKPQFSGSDGLDVDSGGDLYASTINWVFRLTSAGSSVDDWSSVVNARGIALDSTDQVFVVGSAQALRTTDTGGSPVTWTIDNGTDVAVDSAGFVYIAETGFIVKYSSLGVEQWRIPTTVDIQSLDVSSSGELIYGVAFDGTVYRWVQAPGANDEIVAYVLDFAAIGRPLEPNTQYTISAYGWAESATSAMFRIVARLHDGAGNWLAAETAGTQVETDGGWNRAELTFTTPALPGSGVIYLAARSEWVKADWAASDVLGSSALQIETASAATSFFDGDTDPVSQTDGQLQYNWSGIAHSSESVESFHEWAYLTNRDVNGPYGVVGRPARGGVIVNWDQGSKCAELAFRFEAKDQNLYVLDDCGTPGYQECVDIEPGTPEYVLCAPFCDPWCANTPVDGTGPEPVEFTVTGNQRVYPTITLWPDLTGTTTNPVTVENVTDGTFITYAGDVVGEPVIINTQDGTASQGETDVTNLLGGNVTTFSLLPGPYEFRVLTANSDTDSGIVSFCFRPSVISS